MWNCILLHDQNNEAMMAYIERQITSSQFLEVALFIGNTIEGPINHR